MTEKRFSWEVIDNDCLFYDDGAVIDYDDVVDELNALHEENQELKEKLRKIEEITHNLKEE